MASHKKLDEISQRIFALLENPKMADACLSGVQAYMVLEFLEHDYVGSEDVEYLCNTFKDNTLRDNDPINLINKMAYKSREDSHGAVKLEKVLLPVDLYSNMAEKVGLTPDVVLKVTGAVLWPNKNVKSNQVIGLCRPKFIGVPAKQLVILGEINASE